jgi:predicted nucleic acid-binding protein
MIHLDTSFLIRALQRHTAEDLQLRRWLGERIPVGISAVSWTEFLCGPVAGTALALAEDIVGEPAPLLPGDCPVAARLFVVGGRRRGSLADCMIAAIAVRVGADLATSNIADFRRFGKAGPPLLVAGS